MKTIILPSGKLARFNTKARHLSESADWFFALDERDTKSVHSFNLGMMRKR